MRRQELIWKIRIAAKGRGLAFVRTYQVQTRRCGRWWAIEVPEVVGVHSQASNFADVEPMARDAIALMADVPPDSFDLDIAVITPTDAYLG